MRGEKIVSLDAIGKNYELIKSAARGVEIIGVLKADAYGHGGKKVAEHLGLKRCAVATVDEAVALREVLPESEILVLGKTFPDEFGICVKNGVTLAVDDENEVLKLERVARELHAVASVHLAINTGMNRIGAKYDKPLYKFVNAVKTCKRVILSGAFTHLYSTDEYTRNLQKARFLSALDEIKTHKNFIRHIGASSAVGNKNLYLDALRPGIALYGYGLQGFTPAMSVVGRVVAINRIAAGETVGYYGKYRAKKSEYIATLSLGYADGILRREGGQAIVGGKKRDIVGNVCMDACFAVVDERVKVGDDAVFLGRQGGEEITAEDIARRYGAIPYEILTGFKRIKTKYIG